MILCCARCRRRYEAQPLYTSGSQLEMLFDPSDHGSPRMIISLTHPAQRRCPIINCQGELREETGPVGPVGP